MATDDEMDVSLGASRGSRASRLEVLEGPTGRRMRTAAEKARIVAESLLPEASVAEVARKHGTSRWQIYDWRKRIREGKQARPKGLTPEFATLMLEDPSELRLSAPPRKPAPGQALARLELVVDDVLIRAEVGVEQLSAVIRAVRGSR
jgi:transposase